MWQFAKLLMSKGNEIEALIKNGVMLIGKVKGFILPVLKKLAIFK